MDLSILKLNTLAKTYVVSNTPAYLFRKFRTEDCILSFSRECAAEELVELMNNINSIEDKTIKDIVLAYSALIALTFKPPQEVKEQITNIHFSNLDWFQDIVDLWEETYKSDNVVAVFSKPIIKQMESAILTNENALKINVKPKISDKNVNKASDDKVQQIYVGNGP